MAGARWNATSAGGPSGCGRSDDSHLCGGTCGKGPGEKPCSIIRAHFHVSARDASQTFILNSLVLGMILLSRPLDDNRAALLSILSESNVGEVGRCGYSY